MKTGQKVSFLHFTYNKDLQPNNRRTLAVGANCQNELTVCAIFCDFVRFSFIIDRFSQILFNIKRLLTKTGQRRSQHFADMQKPDKESKHEQALLPKTRWGFQLRTGAIPENQMGIPWIK
jgi:hypothetical protein